MKIFDIFATASFEYAVYSNLAATDLVAHLKMIIKEETKLTPPKDLAMKMPKHLEVPILGTATQQLMENNITARIDEEDFRKKQRNCKDRVRRGAKEVFSLLCNHSIVQSWMS